MTKEMRLKRGWERSAIGYAALAVLGLLALGYGIFLSRYTTISDDGAITLRYVERLSSGRGFSYNDGELVNGANDPLLVLLLAGLNGLVHDLLLARSILGILLFMTTLLAGSALLFDRERPLASIPPIALLWSDYYVYVHYFDGLEGGVTCTLITLLFVALYRERLVLAGVVPGLMVANKLDGAIAAAAFSAVFVAQRRRFPWLTALWAAVAVLPVACVLAFYFGSLVPQSLLSKLGGPAHTVVTDFDRGWMIKLIYLVSPVRTWMFLASLAGLYFGRALADRVLGVYLAAYLAAYALVNLGAPYPWYMVPALHLMALGTAKYLEHLVPAIDVRELVTRLDRPGLRAAAAGAVVAAGFGAVLVAAPMVAPVRRLVEADGLAPFELENLSRAAAGAWLRLHAGPGEVQQTGWGLPALEYRGPTFDPSGLTSSPALRRDPQYVLAELETGAPMLSWLRESQLLPGGRPGREYRLVASFPVPGAPHQYAVYAHEGAAVLRGMAAPATGEGSGMSGAAAADDGGKAGSGATAADTGGQTGSGAAATDGGEGAGDGGLSARLEPEAFCCLNERQKAVLRTLQLPRLHIGGP